jgi:hypothetical protein
MAVVMVNVCLFRNNLTLRGYGFRISYSAILSLLSKLSVSTARKI